MSPCCYLDTPVGMIRLVASEQGLHSIAWDEGAGIDPEPDNPCLLLAWQELRMYFAGKLRTFTVPIDISRWQGFTAQVYSALRAVPYGETITYRELARRAGQPAAARAVGGIMARNPLPIILPCHRVIAANGALTGYSGGAGIAAKIFLLHHEKAA
ncbi:MAG: methylated-DNA--[protein]-cysteine S-methyltransferase [Desulfuromonadales bacterium]|nr:methylated-DNA--[protein]-cysteine S-methyltransferase [Desulfuromonadales bacterium]